MFSYVDLEVFVMSLVGWIAMCIVLLGDVLGVFPPSTAGVL